MVATGVLLRAGAALVLVLAGFISQVAPVVARVQPTLAVFVDDHAFITAPTMLIARDEAQRIYAAANVRLLWPGKKDRQAPGVRSAPHLAGKLNAHPGVALGRVFAHELAHLLLATETHTTSGVLATQLDLRGHPLFTRDETARVQAGLAQLSEAVLAREGASVTTLGLAD